MMISRTAGVMPAAHSALARTAGVYTWDSVRGVWIRPRVGLRGLGDSYCDSASALDPLSYVLCLPSDVSRVYNAATADTPAPPGGQPMGAPQTVSQMTQPGLWTPGQAIDAGAAATKQANLQFFSNLANQNTPAGSGLPDLSSTWWWILAAAVAALFLLRR